MTQCIRQNKEGSVLIRSIKNNRYQGRNVDMFDPFVTFLCSGLIEHRIFGCGDHGCGLLTFLPGEGEISVENIRSEVLQEQFIAFLLGFLGELLCQVAGDPARLFLMF